MLYEELIADHGRIDLLADRLGRVSCRDYPGERPVRELLDTLFAEVAAHLSKEEAFIYPHLVASKDPSGAIGLVQEFEALARDWRCYLAAWQTGPSGSDWPRFQQETAGMLHGLRERVMRETGLLYSLALREEAIAMAQPQPCAQPLPPAPLHSFRRRA